MRVSWIMAWLISLALLAGCAVPVAPNLTLMPAAGQTEPQAAQWRTWVMAAGNELRPEAPPDAAATAAELAQLKELVAGRDAEADQMVAYWDAGSPSYRWIELALAHLRANPVSGPRYIRAMGLLNVAIYDAMVATWDAKYSYNRPRPAVLDPSLPVLAQHTDSPSYPSEHAAAAGAAATVLAYLFPDAAQSFLDKAQAAADSRLLAGAHFPSDVQAGLELGRAAAAKVIARAERDDAVPAWNGEIPAGPGHWTGEKPAEPTAGQWQTWVLASGDELRPDPPPAYDSPELAAELQEVMEVPRTFDQTYRAFFWHSAQGDEIWYNFATLRMFEQGLDADPVNAARIYALMSVAHHDAVVACWDGKYTYWTLRPSQLDPALTTVFSTPNHPSYPAGHACVSTAISEVIADQFPAYADAVRALAAEALESRIWAGIHFRSDIDAGREIGMAVARKVLERGRQMTQPAAAPAASPPATTAPSTAAADIPPEAAAGIKRAEEFLDSQHVVGLFNGVALIAQDGNIIWSTARGMADREQEIPNTLQTIYRVNEMTVQFTAAAILLLEQEGKLSLDDPICDYLDNCPAAWQPVTIHHLLSHTSGIPDYFDVAYVAAHKLARDGAAPEAFVALFRAHPLQFEPGEQRRWNHSGFVLAGQIIERVAGQPYGDFVEQRLFAPLGMVNSGFGDPPLGSALGYPSSSAKTPTALPLAPASLYAAGGLYSTAEDLFRWNEALYNSRLLNKPQLQKMLTAHAVTEHNQGSGYGIVVAESLGRRVAGNGGGLDGYAGVIYRYLDDRITTVVIGNQDMDIFWLTDEVGKRFFGDD